MRAEHLPNFEPVTLLGRTYHDLRTVTPAHQDSAAVYQLSALASVVPELLCQSSVRPDTGDRTGFDLNTRDMVADLYPVGFGVFEGLQCVESFGLYAITLVDPNPGLGNFSVSTRLQPGFLSVLEEESEYARLIAQLMEELSAERLRLENGKRVDILTVQVSLEFLDDTDTRQTEADRRVRAVQRELLRREGSDTRHRSAPYKQGRLHDVARQAAP